MKIGTRKPLIELNNLEEFIQFVSKEIKNLKPGFFPDELISFWHNNKNSEIKNSKEFYKIVKTKFFSDTLLNTKYWVSRGWNLQEANVKIHEIQTDRSEKFHIKMKILKDTNPDIWKSKMNTNLEFYINKGYSIEESTVLLKERQKTFSKEKCLEKYGDSGLDVWRERQEKWLESMKSFTDNYKKDSRSSQSLKNKFGKDWVLEGIKISFNKNRDVVEKSLKNSTDLESFLNELVEKKQLNKIEDIVTIYSSKILQNYFEIDQATLKDKMLSKYGIKSSLFGNIRYFNGHICRSNGEYYIAKKLKDLGIEYLYEKKYPNSKFVCDFFIPKFNLYIEYLGFIKTDYMNDTNIEVCKKYIEKYEKKEKFCLDNSINFIFESDYKILIKKIINYDKSNSFGGNEN